MQEALYTESWPCKLWPGGSKLSVALRAAIPLQWYLDISCRQLPLFVRGPPQLFNKPSPEAQLLFPLLTGRALKGALQPQPLPRFGDQQGRADPRHSPGRLSSPCPQGTGSSQAGAWQLCSPHLGTTGGCCKCPKPNAHPGRWALVPCARQEGKAGLSEALGPWLIAVTSSQGEGRFWGQTDGWIKSAVWHPASCWSSSHSLFCSPRHWQISSWRYL